MKPFHFGSSKRTLFGFLHPPQTPARPVGVVLCNPMGQEGIRAHRAYRQLAFLLARTRFHVLRFDYFGTGDSAGEVDEGDPGQWIDDIGTAIEELKDTSGVAKVALVGLRLGASMALHAAMPRKDVDTVVMWDPVVSGPAYLKELKAMHVEYLERELGHNFDPVAAAEANEALGFPLTAALVRGISAIDLTTAAVGAAKNVALVVSRRDDAYQQLSGRLLRQGVNVTYQEVEAERWNSDEAMNAAIVPNEILKAIVASLT